MREMHIVLNAVGVAPHLLFASLLEVLLLAATFCNDACMSVMCPARHPDRSVCPYVSGAVIPGDV